MNNEESASERARWLADLSEALDEARRLVRQLEPSLGQMEAVNLYARIETIKFEVEAMRLRRSFVHRDFHPEWTKDLPWKRSA